MSTTRFLVLATAGEALLVCSCCCCDTLNEASGAVVSIAVCPPAAGFSGLPPNPSSSPVIALLEATRRSSTPRFAAPGEAPTVEALELAELPAGPPALADASCASSIPAPCDGLGALPGLRTDECAGATRTACMANGCAADSC